MADELYELLGVDKRADDKTIKRAYRKRAKAAHPDNAANLDKEAATAETARLNTAALVLLDPVKRARYDETGAEAESDIVTASAVNNITFMLTQFMTAPSEVPDYKAAMIAHFRTKQAEIRQAVAPSQRLVSRAERIKSNWKRKKVRGKASGEDFVGRAILWQVEQHKRLIDKAENDVRVLDRAIEILETYTYAAEVGRTSTSATTTSTVFIRF